VKKVVVKPISKPLVKPTPIVKKKIIPVVKKKTVPVKEVLAVEEPMVIEKEIELTPVVVEEIAVVEPEVVEEVKQEHVVAKAMLTQMQEIIPVVNVTPEEQYMDENLAIINALIKRNLSYPRLAKKRGLQGKAMVLFTLDKEGNIVEISASGEVASILKKSALKTVKKASNSFPKPSQALTLQIPIVYKLH
jgi:protein TonB